MVASFKLVNLMSYLGVAWMSVSPSPQSPLRRNNGW